MSGLVSRVLELVRSFLDQAEARPGSSKEVPMELLAVPGLVTLLDVALFQTVEGQLTGTLTTAHALLAVWLDLQRQAVRVLQEIPDRSTSFQLPLQQARFLQMENWARSCLEAACDALHRLQTDRLAASANLSDPYDAAVEFGTTNASAALEASLETGRKRYPLHQRPEDCWESPRLHCLDYVWAEDAWQNSLRLLTQLRKHAFVAQEWDSSAPPAVAAVASSFRNSVAKPNNDDSFMLSQNLRRLWLLVQTDLPTRLLQFRAAVEAETVVSKRLYLLKCEYRAPFRAFLEAHHAVHRAPSLSIVKESLARHNQKESHPKKLQQDQTNAKERLQKLLSTPVLVECLALEQRCSEYETAMSEAVFSFGELARYLETKNAQPKDPAHASFQELLRRLALLRSGHKTSIRPLLLDLQGVPRDEEALMGYESCEADDESDLTALLDDLETLASICAGRNAFRVVGKRIELDIPSSIARGCSQFDRKVFRAHYLDWRAMVDRQAELTREHDLHALAERLRQAEMQASLAGASPKALEVVRQRLESLRSDRDTRLQVLQAMVQEVCLREMNLYVKLEAANLDKVWSLPKTSALGVFGRALQLAGEPLPIG